MSTDLSVETVTKLKTPNLYKVVLLNDDFTPMEFVIQVLKDIFNKDATEAHALTIQIHQVGRGVAGIFTKEVADQKVADAMVAARQYQHPLKTISEIA